MQANLKIYGSGLLAAGLANYALMGSAAYCSPPSTLEAPVSILAFFIPSDMPTIDAEAAPLCITVTRAYSSYFIELEPTL